MAFGRAMLATGLDGPNAVDTNQSFFIAEALADGRIAELTR